MLRIISYKLIITCMVSLLLSSYAEAEDFDKEYNAIITKTKKLFNQKKWTEIEAFANKSREQKSTITCGEPTLMFIYRGLFVNEYLKNSSPDAVWEAWYKNLNDWEKHVPNSITLPAVKIVFWTSYAWKARNGGASDDDWIKFILRLDKAHEIFKNALISAPHKKYTCPGFYLAAMLIAPGQEWDKDVVNKKLLQPAITLNPMYLEAYLLYKRQWVRNEGDDYRFYASLLDRLGGITGKEVYSRLIINEKLHEITNYRPKLVDWNAVQEGLLESIRHNPKSLHLLTSSIKFAYRYGDQQELLKKINKVAPALVREFYTKTPYGKAFQLQQKHPESSLKKIRYYKPLGNRGIDSIRSISNHPNGKLFTTTCSRRGVKIFSLDSGKTLNKLPNYNNITNLSVFSPCGKYLFVGSMYDFHNKKTTRPLQVFSYKNGKLTLIRKLEGKYDIIRSAIFTPDSKKIILSHLSTKNHGFPEARELFVWDWLNKDSTPVKFFSAHTKLEIKTLTIDKKQNFLYCNGDNVWRFDIANLSSSPTPLIKAPQLKNALILDYAFLKEGTIFIALVWEKNNYELVAIDRNNGSVLKKMIINNYSDNPSYLETITSTKNKTIIATSGGAGCISTWNFTIKKGQPEIKFESIIPTNGQTTYSLKTITSDDNKQYLIQGTENGMIGIYTAK